MVLRVDDKLIDASVKNQLEAMKRQLLAATPR
jgi:F0F1-type ATP synthase delta subunit